MTEDGRATLRLVLARTYRASEGPCRRSARRRVALRRGAQDIRQDDQQAKGGPASSCGNGNAGHIAAPQAERVHREALISIVEEGTNDIQKLVIARRMLDGNEALIPEHP